MTDYEIAMINASSISNQTLQRVGGVISDRNMLLKEIEGLEAKIRWDHVSNQQILLWQARIDDLKALLNS